MKLTPQLAAIMMLLFLVVGISIAAGPNPPAAASLGDSWTASVAAETAGDYDEALKQSAAWHAAGGGAYMAKLRTGWLHSLKKEYPNALASYSEASRLNPASITPLYGMLAAAQGMNSREKISTTADLILKTEPTNYKALMAKANLQFALLDYRKALSLYRRVLVLYPEDLNASSGFAWSALYLGERRDAQKVFQGITSMNPDYPWAKQGLEQSSRP